MCPCRGSICLSINLNHCSPTHKKNNHNTSLAPLQHCLGCSKHIVDPLSLSFSPVEQRGQKDSRETELGAWNPPQPHRWQRVEISDWPPAVPSLRPLSCRHQDFWLSLPSPLASILQTRVGGAEPFAEKGAPRVRKRDTCVEGNRQGP